MKNLKVVHRAGLLQGLSPRMNWHFDESNNAVLVDRAIIIHRLGSPANGLKMLSFRHSDSDRASDD